MGGGDAWVQLTLSHVRGDRTCSARYSRELSISHIIRFKKQVWKFLECTDYLQKLKTFPFPRAVAQNSVLPGEKLQSKFCFQTPFMLAVNMLQPKSFSLDTQKMPFSPSVSRFSLINFDVFAEFPTTLWVLVIYQSWTGKAKFCNQLKSF